MNRFFQMICGLFLLISFTGCIEIFEELTLDKRGSGHYRNQMDMSGLISAMSSMQSMVASEGNATANGKMNDPFQEVIKKWEGLKKMSGIRNVRIKNDTTASIYSYDFDFDNPTALNQALFAIGEKEKNSEPIYAITASSLTRMDNDLTGALGQVEDQAQEEMMKGMLSEMKYHIFITLPSKVKSVSNKHAKIVDKNSVKLDASFEELTDQSKSLGMQIRY